LHRQAINRESRGFHFSAGFFTDKLAKTGIPLPALYPFAELALDFSKPAGMVINKLKGLLFHN